MSGERDHELYKRRRARNWLIAGVLGALVVTLFAVTLVKMRDNATNPMAELFDPQLRYRDQTPEIERSDAPEPAAQGAQAQPAAPGAEGEQ